MIFILSLLLMVPHTHHCSLFAALISFVNICCFNVVNMLARCDTSASISIIRFTSLHVTGFVFLCACRVTAVPVFKLLEKYRPEDKAAKKLRLKGAAEAKVAGAADDSKRPRVLKFGLNHITHLVETGKAGYVVIASDVDPIEVCVHAWLPLLGYAVQYPCPSPECG